MLLLLLLQSSRSTLLTLGLADIVAVGILWVVADFEPEAGERASNLSPTSSVQRDCGSREVDDPADLNLDPGDPAELKRRKRGHKHYGVSPGQTLSYK